MGNVLIPYISFMYKYCTLWHFSSLNLFVLARISDDVL